MYLYLYLYLIYTHAHTLMHTHACAHTLPHPAGSAFLENRNCYSSQNKPATFMRRNWNQTLDRCPRSCPQERV